MKDRKFMKVWISVNKADVTRKCWSRLLTWGQFKLIGSRSPVAGNQGILEAADSVGDAADLAHCCTIFLKSSGYRNIYNIEIQISISERSSGWAINYCGPCQRIIFDIRSNFTLLWRRIFYIVFIKFPVDCVNFLIDMDLDTTSEEENYLYFLKTHVKE